jgi:hypothetical protein
MNEPNLQHQKLDFPTRKFYIALRTMDIDTAEEGG